VRVRVRGRFERLGAHSLERSRRHERREADLGDEGEIHARYAVDMGEIRHERREADLGDEGEIHARYAVDMGEIWHERREADLARAAATLPGDHL
jgi:hypothetical protein